MGGTLGHIIMYIHSAPFAVDSRVPCGGSRNSAYSAGERVQVNFDFLPAAHHAHRWVEAALWHGYLSTANVDAI